MYRYPGIPSAYTGALFSLKACLKEEGVCNLVCKLTLEPNVRLDPLIGPNQARRRGLILTQSGRGPTPLSARLIRRIRGEHL